GRLPAVPSPPEARRRSDPGERDAEVFGAQHRRHAAAFGARRRLGILDRAVDPERTWRGDFATGGWRWRAAAGRGPHVHAERRLRCARRALTMIGRLLGRFGARLRYPALFKLLLVLFVVDFFVPDVI